MSTLSMKAVATVAALSIGALALPQTADAGSRHRHHHRGGGNAAAAIVGLGVGALIGSAIASDRYYYYDAPPPRAYYPPPPPPPPYYDYDAVAYAPPPWTPEWYSYCYSKYRSFDRYSGTFVGYDGRRHFCR